MKKKAGSALCSIKLVSKVVAGLLRNIDPLALGVAAYGPSLYSNAFRKSFGPITFIGVLPRKNLSSRLTFMQCVHNYIGVK